MKKVYKEQDQYDKDHNMVFVEYVEERSMVNKKPYRNKEQQLKAKATAVKCKDGAWRSNVLLSYHKR